jgi:hypothetical protein
MVAYALRYLLIDSNDEIFRLPAARLQRILFASETEPLSQFAGQRVRTVELVVETEQRKPICVRRALFHYFHFDREGRLDYDRYMEDGVTVAEAGAPDFYVRFRNPKIINAEKRFAIRRRDHSAWWKPAPQLEEAIMDVALGLKKCHRI